MIKIKQEEGLLSGIATCWEHNTPMILVEEDSQDGYMCIFEAVN